MGADGYRNQCKACTLAWVREFGAANVGKGSKAWIKRNAPYVRKRARNHYHKFPKKQSAYRVVKEALKYGWLKRLPCAVCGNEKVHGHHEDYEKPLDVIWLCPFHHAEIHKVGATWLLEGWKLSKPRLTTGVRFDGVNPPRREGGRGPPPPVFFGSGEIGGVGQRHFFLTIFLFNQVG